MEYKIHSITYNTEDQNKKDLDNLDCTIIILQWKSCLKALGYCCERCITKIDKIK